MQIKVINFFTILQACIVAKEFVALLISKAKSITKHFLKLVLLHTTIIRQVSTYIIIEQAVVLEGIH